MTLLTATPSVGKAIKPKHWLDGWHVTPTANRDYDFIDGLRGIAILMVIVAHAFYINPNAGFAVTLAGNIIGTGGYGVTLFFALSGFLIAWPFWKRKVSGSDQVAPRGYFQRRFWKIYPPLALSVIIFTPFFMFLLNPAARSEFIPAALRWLSGAAFLWPVSGKFNPVMWTLVLEAQFYLLLPLFFLAFRRLSPKGCLAGFTVVFLVVPVGYRLITKQPFGPTFHPDINSHFPSGLDSFFLGILIAGLDAMGFVKKSWKWLGIAGVVLWPLTLLIAGWTNMHPDSKTFTVAEFEYAGLKLAGACLILFIAQPQHWIARLLCAQWLRWCGIISYECYLFHQPLLTYARDYFGPAGGAIYKYAFITGIPITVSLIFSALVYRYFSLPILRHGRGKNQA
jgi:peptidoglycan/LPS O-acetylase OafA/YrhL